MSEINRREFTAAALASVAASVLGRSAAAADGPKATLPTVRWGKHDLSRVLVGHNPLKGVSHFNEQLSREMLDYFSDGHAHGRELLRRCQQCGINTCQMGSPAIEELLRLHYAEGGTMQWIATFYSAPGKGKEELARILEMDPRPIGAQHFGGTTDGLWREGKLDQARDTLKMLRDAGLLVGLCTHNHEVIDYAESKGWDVDFYQGSFFRVTYARKTSDKDFNTSNNEVFEEEGRQSMAKTLSQVSKPCIAFKVLGASRLCQTPEGVERAIRFALEKIKPSDVVLLGMWQKHRDQVAENTALARKALALT